MPRPCGHTDDKCIERGKPFTPGQCPVCWWDYHDERHRMRYDGVVPPRPSQPPPDYGANFPALWDGLPRQAPDDAARPVSAEPMRSTMRLPCVHLGKGTGETGTCSTCGGEKQEKVHACAVHGKCTIVRKVRDAAVVCCAFCPDYDTGVVQMHLNHGGGIGDHLCALACAEGLRQSGQARTIILAGRSGELAWLRPFAGDIQLREDVQPSARTLVFDINDYARWRRQRRARWEYWSGLCGVPPALPAYRPSPEEVERARAFAGVVILVPFAVYAERTWPLERWLWLESLLRARGFRCLVLDDRHGRCERFVSEKMTQQPPPAVTAAVAAAGYVVGNDSGIVHLAGVLRRPT